MAVEVKAENRRAVGPRVIAGTFVVTKHRARHSKRICLSAAEARDLHEQLGELLKVDLVSEKS